MKGKIKYITSLTLSKKINRKVVVIESDDWGSERIPNKEIRNTLIKNGVDMESNPHSRYDSLERFEDLILLEELLVGFQKKYGKAVSITANFITANPDYAKIKATDFNTYFFESFDKTYEKRDHHKKVLNQVFKLISHGYFKPQFHGREHINALYWLDELKAGNKNFRLAFDNNTYGIDAVSSKLKRKNLMAALEYENPIQKQFVEESLKEGHQMFETIFGYPSKTFIPPRYVWNSELEPAFVKCGFTHLQSALFQQAPTEKGYKYVFHYTGQRSRSTKIRFLTRNVFFEPAYGHVDWVIKAFSKINLAFRFNTPAIISMHRINFVGGLDSMARDKHLDQFRQLLELVVQKYPEVEFLSSNELAELV